MKIGELSRATATKVTTIRFYEEIGLLDRPVRTASGRRTYALRDVERLNFVRNGRRLGFSIEEIRSLIALASEPGRDCGEAMAIASRHLAVVEERLEQLTALRDELAVMSRNCDRQRIADCRVIQAIARPAA
ncbi:helix-turn-helix domain-containing protein [uncultured Sphingomonas sp.]|uniref:MerR family transcriptional regulator n=1 Tax=uncultured Sphingomonas sp. TaxID=158754 RepID=UPI002617585B|nr:helix-turn-helix domain-containing protein [uncultured Sphingomonas sp.]